MDKTVKLLQGVKPCPFCGSTIDLELHDDGAHLPEVRCMNCGGGMWGETHEGAIQAWNRRPPEGAEGRRGAALMEELRCAAVVKA